MAHMHGLGDIGAAIVHQDPPRRLDHGRAQAGIVHQLIGPGRQGVGAHSHIDEAQAGDLHRGQPRILGQLGHHAGGDLAGVAARLLGRRQGAIALEVGQVGPVGRRHTAKLGRQTRSGEGGRNRLPQAPFEVGHWLACAVPAATSVPTSIRKRFPARLNSAISGVTSKPTRTSKFAPLVVS